MDQQLLQQIASVVGTPFYCYDAEDIRQRFRRLRLKLPSSISYFYSLKANPNKGIVSIIYAEGTGCEVCSLAELETAVAAQVKPTDIIFLGPGKSVPEIIRCVELQIKAIIVESLDEILLVENIAASRGVTQPIALRINPASKGGKAQLIMSGRPTQFGIDEEQLCEAMAILHACMHVKLVGMHVYMGSRILKAASIIQNTKQILDLALRLARVAGGALTFVDVGGGFGVNYFDGEVELDIDELGTQLSEVIAMYQRLTPATEIIFELGRYLVAQSGVFVTAIRNLKHSKGRLFAICDGGTNCHGAAGGLGAMFRRNFPISRIGGPRQGGAAYTVTGPLCTPADVLGEAIVLGELQVGDLIGIFLSGAYGPSASAVHFLGFGHPAEVLVEGNRVQLIRHRDSIEEALGRQVAIPIDLPARTTTAASMAPEASGGGNA